MDWHELSKSLGRDDLPAPLFVFGLHKAGSTLMHDMVGEACALMKIPRLDVPGLAFKEGLTADKWASDEALLPIFQRGMIFYGFRFLPQVLLHPEIKIQASKFVLLVRDPRDALVSQYFSFGGRHLSHILPEKNKEAFVASARKTADLDIDDYVIKMAKGYQMRMAAYHQHLDFDCGLLRRYEDIYYDKLTFLQDIFAHFGLKTDQTILRQVAEKNDIRPTQEDPTKHIRKGTPGDYAAKLRPDTIARLNEIFFATGREYGYAF